MPTTTTDPAAPLDDERAMTPQELREKLQITRSTFARYQASGKFQRFELMPRFGQPRYCRQLVSDYLNRRAPSTRLRMAAAR